MSEASVRQSDFIIVNGDKTPGDDLAMQCEAWLADICAASWASKEAMKMAAIISQCVQTFPPKAAFTRDMESAYALQAEDIARALKLLKLFGAIVEFDIERGRLTVKARLSYSQRLRVAETRASLARLAGDAEATVNVTALRAVLPEAEAPAAPEPPVAITS
jgi:hypothetical protein